MCEWVCTVRSCGCVHVLVPLCHTGHKGKSTGQLGVVLKHHLVDSHVFEDHTQLGCGLALMHVIVCGTHTSLVYSPPWVQAC